MPTTRKHYSGQFKAKVALEAIRGEKTLNALAAQYGVHPVQISHWRKQVLEALPQLFSSGGGEKATRDGEAQKAALYEQIGRLKVELEWLKKKAGWGE